MATELIDEIIGQPAFDQVAKLKSEMESLVGIFIQLNKEVAASELNTSTAQNIRQTSDSIKQTTAGLSEMDKIKKKLVDTSKQYEAAMTLEAQLLELNKQALKDANKETANFVKQQTAAEGSINQMSATLIKLRMQYDALGKSMREGAFGKDLLKKIQDQDAALKALDATTGRFQRNVGNYTQATMSLSQVFRELPAFTYSAQTGILGISNNLPILADNFKQVAKATNEATGKINGTMGALKIFGASIFSMGNIFTIALGLFTIFSKEIFDFVRGTKEADKATKELTDSIGKETGKLETNIRILNDKNASHRDHLRVAEELKKMYPTALKNYNLEEIAAGKAAGAIGKIATALKAVAMARAAQADMDKFASQRYENDKKLEELRAQLIAAQGQQRIAMQAARLSTGPKNQEFAINAANKATNSIRDLKDSIKEVLKANIELDAQMDKTANTINSFAGTASDAGITLEGNDVSKGQKKKKDKKPYVKPVIKPTLDDDDIAELKKYYAELKAWNEEYLKEWMDDPALREALEIELSDMVNTSEPISEEKSKELQESLRKHFEKKANLIQFNIDREKLIKKMQDVQDIVAAALQGMASISDLIFDSEMSNIDRREKAMQESYDAEEKRINRSFTNQADKERELTKLEAIREAQQKAIDRDRRAAERKRAQAGKAYDVASIITGTAVATVAALGMKPYTPLNIALAAATAATGAANLARAIATPIPQYAKGTENHPGGPAIVGEQGAELIELPGGGKMITPGKATLFPHLPEGTKVKTHDEFMKGIYQMAMLKLGNGNPVTTGTMARAMIETFEENTDEIKKLRRDINEKQTGVSIYGNFDHYMHIKNNIR